MFSIVITNRELQIVLALSGSKTKDTHYEYFLVHHLVNLPTSRSKGSYTKSKFPSLKSLSLTSASGSLLSNA